MAEKARCRGIEARKRAFPRLWDPSGRLNGTGEKGFLDVRVDGSLHPERATSQARALIASGFVPTRFLYETPAQARAWQALAASFSPAQAPEDGRLAYSEVHAKVAAIAGSNAIQLVGLGCGDGTKEADLAMRLAAQGTVSSVPVDVSLPLVQVAASRVSAASGARVDRALLVDLESSKTDIGKMIGREGAGLRIATLYGALPWLGFNRIREILRSLLGPDDLLCVSANLRPASETGLETVVAQYDNPATRAWIGMLLERLGATELASNLRFEVRPPQSNAVGETIVGVVESGSATTVEIDDAEISTPPRSELELFRSTRHRPEDLAAFCESAGLRLEHLVISPSGEEGIALARF